MSQAKLIVFDMDGVIVDVSRSYREAVRRTARLFFKGILSEDHLPDPLFSLAELATVKQVGGLNNDWDLTYHVLDLLMSQVETPLEKPDGKGWACLEYLMARCEASALARFLASSSTPLTDLEKRRPVTRNHWTKHLSTGDVGTGNIVKQIFQELYLGGTLFRQTYGSDAKIHDGPGLIDRESLLIPSSTFEHLANEHTLALATGRPRSEAEHALRRFNLQSYFKMIYTLDECMAEERRRFHESGQRLSVGKPHPYMLDTIVDQCPVACQGLYYVGDMPDDMQAAANSDFAYQGIGILHAAPDRHALRQGLIGAGAAAIIEDADELLAYFS
jgi:HAD superfamily hydrolase (TIGR01548 family)